MSYRFYGLDVSNHRTPDTTYSFLERMYKIIKTYPDTKIVSYNYPKLNSPNPYYISYVNKEGLLAMITLIDSNNFTYVLTGTVRNEVYRKVFFDDKEKDFEVMKPYIEVMKNNAAKHCIFANSFKINN